MYQFTFMEIGTIFVGDHIFPLLVKLENILNLLRFQALIGEVTLIMKCLQRIYGTSWASQKDLDEYLKRIEEAEKRDHRKLGKEMDLFHFREESPGSVFWHEKGWALFQKLINYMRS